MFSYAEYKQGATLFATPYVEPLSAIFKVTVNGTKPESKGVRNAQIK